MRRENGGELVIVLFLLVVSVAFWISKEAGVSFEAGLNVLGNGVIATFVLGFWWYQHRYELFGDIVQPALTAFAGASWFVSWPILDFWGHAPVNRFDPMPWENTAWYSSWMAQWGILALCGVATVWLSHRRN